MKNIDGVRLGRALMARGLSNQEVSKELGYRDNMITESIETGYMPVVAQKLLELMFSIPRTLYTISGEGGGADD